MQDRNSFARNALVVGSAVAAALSLSHHADARSVSAGIATAEKLDIDCFEVYYGSLTNRCAQQKKLIMPLFVEDPGGTKTVRVSGFNPSPTSNTLCRTEVYHWEGTFAGDSGNVYFPSTGNGDMVMTVSVPSYGYMVVSCTVDPNLRINLVNWNP